MADPETIPFGYVHTWLSFDEHFAARIIDEVFQPANWTGPKDFAFDVSRAEAVALWLGSYLADVIADTYLIASLRYAWPMIQVAAPTLRGAVRLGGTMKLKIHDRRYVTICRLPALDLETGETVLYPPRAIQTIALDVVEIYRRCIADFKEKGA